MSDGRKCSVYLPNERELEILLQPKLLGKDLIDIVATHFKLKEKEYFGIAYKSEGGFNAWLQDEKKVLDHDIAKKSGSVIDLQFAVKFYVESISSLKQSRTIEIFFLHIKSLVYKGQLEIEDSDTAFKLASFILQATCGDYVDDESSQQQISRLPLLPNKVLREHPKQDCDSSIIAMHKAIKGYTKGKAILSYMTLVESLPTYGVHYYKVKDKGGLAWWLGLSYKGIHQYQINDRIAPSKTFSWRQLENLYFRDKKFSIEVNDFRPRINSTGAKDRLGVDSNPRTLGTHEVKTHTWYGSPALIKCIWIMAISQHHYYLDRKQSKTKLTSATNLTNLSNDLTSNPHSLITQLKDAPTKETPLMTRKQIRDVDVTVKKGSKDESPEVRAAKEEMVGALRSRRTELEDRLYDKVQELKKLCLQEADIIGKLPPEYIRYMDPDEQRPKIKKRIGAEFKIKLKGKNKNNHERDIPVATVTAASSSSSGFSSEANDASDELGQLETEFEILTQIASAAKKLAADPNANRRTRTKRLGSYKKSIDKLQVVEGKINVLRKKVGQKPSDRASILIDQSSDLIHEDGVISFRDGTESERSSLSDGLLLDDDTSLSSGGDALSTHSTPAILNQSPSPRPATAAPPSRTNGNPADVDMKEVLAIQRSVTPPPSFDRVNQMVQDNKSFLYRKVGNPDKRRTAHPTNNQQNTSRNWISVKWDPPRSRSKQGWHESSLDSIETSSTTSRLSEEPRSPDRNGGVSPTHSYSKIKLTQPLDPSRPQRVDIEPDLATASRLRVREADGRLSANSNQNNHNARVSASQENLSDNFNMRKLTREMSDSALSELSTKSTPVVLATNSQSRADPEAKRKAESSSKLPKIDETSLQSDRFRKRSSSFTESSRNHQGAPESHRGQKGNPQDHNSYNVPSASGNPPPIIFDTNLNIRMQYLTRSSGHISMATPVPPQWSHAHGHAPMVRPLSRQNSGPYYPPPPYYRENPYARQGGFPPGYIPQMQNNQPVYFDESHPTEMSSSQRDQLNNEVYSDIGMGWVPSLLEYSSRASVAESASAVDKKEDIRRLLQSHIADKKRPSVTGSHQGETTSKSSGSGQTWAEYQKQLLTSGKSPHGANPLHHSDSTSSRASIFQHKPPPLPPNPPTTPGPLQPTTNNAPFLLYQTQKQPKLQHQRSVTQQQQPPLEAAYRPYNTIGHHGNHQSIVPPAIPVVPDAKRRILLQHYLHHPQCTAPPSRDYFESSVPAKQTTQTAPRLAAPQRWNSDDARLLPSNGGTPLNPDPGSSDFVGTEGSSPNTVVLQQLTQSPEGHTVSAFKVTKSAPNTPLDPPLAEGSSFFGTSPAKDDFITSKNLTSGHRHQSADDLLSASRHHNDVTNPVIVHTPSFKSRIKPSLVPYVTIDHGDVTDCRRSRGRTTLRSDDVTPMPPPRVKRAASKSRKEAKAATLGRRDVRARQSPSPPTVTSHSNTLGRNKPKSSNLSPNLKLKVRKSPTSILRDSPTLRKSPSPKSGSFPRKSRDSQTPTFGNSPSPKMVDPFSQRFADSPTMGKSPSPNLGNSPSRRFDSPTFGESPGFTSGTLPRASRRKLAPAPALGNSPARARLTLDVAAARKSRRNSLIEHYLYEQNPASAPTTPTGTPQKNPFTQRSRGFPSPSLSAHHRSKSEAFRLSADNQQHLSHAPFVEVPHPRYNMEYHQQPPNYQTIAGSKPGARYPRDTRHRDTRPRDTTQRDTRQFSASAEDLLWTDTNDSQAGTLV